MGSFVSEQLVGTRRLFVVNTGPYVLLVVRAQWATSFLKRRRFEISAEVLTADVMLNTIFSKKVTACFILKIYYTIKSTNVNEIMNMIGGSINNDNLQRYIRHDR
jgi:hypothetical protein